jgi:hypothetical protein
MSALLLLADGPVGCSHPFRDPFPDVRTGGKVYRDQPDLDAFRLDLLPHDLGNPGVLARVAQEDLIGRLLPR